MRQEVYEKNGFKLVRVSKATARKRYYEGQPILLYQCNANPESPLCGAIEIAKGRSDNFGYDDPFDVSVNHFEYYNCQYNYLGRYAKFFIRTEEH